MLYIKANILLKLYAPIFLQFRDTREKLADITSSVISAINSRCQCSLTSSHIRTNSEIFHCTSDRQVVLYRAELSGHPDCEQVLSYIEQWIRGGQTSVIVQSNSIKVYSNCPIEVDSLTAQADCVRPTTFGTDSTTPIATAVEGGFGITPIAGGVGGVVLIAIIVLAAVLACICVHRCKKKRRR